MEGTRVYPPVPGTLLRIPGSTVVVTKKADLYEVRRGDLTGRHLTDARLFHSIPEWLKAVGAPDDVEIKERESKPTRELTPEEKRIKLMFKCYRKSYQMRYVISTQNKLLYWKAKPFFYFLSKGKYEPLYMCRKNGVIHLGRLDEEKYELIIGTTFASIGLSSDIPLATKTGFEIYNI